MDAPRDGWPFVAWWALGLGAAVGLAAIGQENLAAAVVGGLLGASIPRGPRGAPSSSPPPAAPAG